MLLLLAAAATVHADLFAYIYIYAQKTYVWCSSIWQAVCMFQFTGSSEDAIENYMRLPIDKPPSISSIVDRTLRGAGWFSGQVIKQREFRREHAVPHEPSPPDRRRRYMYPLHPARPQLYQPAGRLILRRAKRRG